MKKENVDVIFERKDNGQCPICKKVLKKNDKMITLHYKGVPVSVCEKHTERKPK